jgi:predicted nucleic acid-binding protein
MLIVDASCLYEMVARSERADEVRVHLDEHPDSAAPHVIDVEVLSIIRRKRLQGRLDETAASLAVEDLQAWPGRRFPHRDLLWRAWELRHNVGGWDAFYVALAEVLDATLLTLDRRLGRIKGLECAVTVLD